MQHDDTLVALEAAQASPGHAVSPHGTAGGMLSRMWRRRSQHPSTCDTRRPDLAENWHFQSPGTAATFDAIARLRGDETDDDLGPEERMLAESVVATLEKNNLQRLLALKKLKEQSETIAVIKSQTQHIINYARVAVGLSSQLHALELRSQCQRTEICSRVLSRMLRQQMAKSWECFVTNVYACKQNGKIMRKVVARITNLQVKRAWERWLQSLDAGRLQRSREQAAEDARLAHYNLMAECQLRANENVNKEAARRVQLCQQMLRRMLKHQLSHAWNLFVECIFRVKNKRHVVCHVLTRMQHLTLSRAMQRYVSAISTILRGREHLLHVIARWKKPGLKRPWQTWCEMVQLQRHAREREAHEKAKSIMTETVAQHQVKVVAEKERYMSICKRVVLKMVRQNLAKCWQSFVRSVTVSKKNRAVLLRMVQRLQHRQLAAAFLCYAACIGAARWQRVKQANALANWKSPSLKRAWEAWGEYVGLVLEERAEQGRSMARRQMEQAYASFEAERAAWKEQAASDLDKARSDAVRLLQQTSVAVAEAQQARQSRIQVCKQTVRRMLKQHLAMAWSHFVDSLERVGKTRATLRRVLARLTHARLAAAFACYAQHVGAIAEERERVLHAVATWRKPGLKKAWVRLRSYAKACRAEEAEAASKLQLQQLLDAAQRTQDLAEAEALRRVDICARVVRRMLQRQLANSWRAFVGSVAACKRNRITLKRVLRRMQHQQLTRAFNCYSQRVTEVSAQKSRVDDALTRWRTPQLRQAWEAWGVFMDIMFTERGQDAKEIAAEYLQQRLASSEASMQELATRCQKQEQRQLEMCSRLLRRLLQHQLAMAWNHFSVSCSCAQTKRETLRRAVARLLRRQIAAAFDVYALHVSDSIRSKQVCTKLIFRIKSRSIACAFRLWQQRHLEACADRAEATRRERVMHKVVSRMRMQIASSALQRWIVHSTEERALQRKAARVVGRWLQQVLSHVFSAWRQHAAAESRKYYLMAKIVVRLQLRCLVAAHEKWAGAVAAAVACRALEARQVYIKDKIVRRMFGRSMLAAFARWCDNILERKIMTTKIKRVLARWRNQTLALCVGAWYSHTAKETRKRVLMAGIVKKMQVRQRSSAWSTWATVTRDEKRRKGVLFKTMKRILRRALSLSFSRWVSDVKQRTLMAAKASKVVSRWRHRTSALFVVLWHLHTEEEVGKRRCMSKIIKRMLSRTIVQAFDSWKSNVQEIRRQMQVLSRVVTRLSLRTLAMSFDWWAVSVPAAIEERMQRDMAIKFDGVRSSLGIALKSLNESEAARSRLEGMVVSLSDELQQVQRDKENALKGSEKVLGVSRDKWRLSVSPQSASTSKSDSNGEILEAKRQLVAVRAGLRTIRGEVKALRRELHACASGTDDSLMTHDSSFATQQGEGEQSQEMAMEREANARLAAELEHVRTQLEQARSSDRKRGEQTDAGGWGLPDLSTAAIAASSIVLNMHEQLSGLSSPSKRGPEVSSPLPGRIKPFQTGRTADGGTGPNDGEQEHGGREGTLSSSKSVTVDDSSNRELTLELMEERRMRKTLQTQVFLVSHDDPDNVFVKLNLCAFVTLNTCANYRLRVISFALSDNANQTAHCTGGRGDSAKTRFGNVTSGVGKMPVAADGHGRASGSSASSGGGGKCGAEADTSGSAASAFRYLQKPRSCWSSAIILEVCAASCHLRADCRGLIGGAEAVGSEP